MCERKIWQEDEDRILIELYEKNGMRKWSEISKIMMQEYGITARNGKQCRERYQNHLKKGINKQKWSRQQQMRLIELHIRYGNRWALISKQINGRTQNCVKNMLYSKLRKSLRQLNRFIYENYRKELKQIKINFIYRLVEFTQQTFNKDPCQFTEQQIIGLKIKNQFLKMSFQEEDQFLEGDTEDIKSFIQKIHAFKRANQRFRGNPNKHYRQRSNKRMKERVQVVSDMLEQPSGDSEDSENEEQIEQSVPSKSKAETQEYQVKHHLVEEEVFLQKDHKGMESISKPLRLHLLDHFQPTFLVDYVLEKPIQVELSYSQLYKTPGQNRFEDWSSELNQFGSLFYL